MVYIAIYVCRRRIRDEPAQLLYFVFVRLVFFMQPVALRLVCHGDAARCESALYPNSGPFIQCLTQSASFHTTGLNFLVDGQHEAMYVARGACRDVYRIGGSIVLKLCTQEKDSNQQEAAALQATLHLP